MLGDPRLGTIYRHLVGDLRRGDRVHLLQRDEQLREIGKGRRWRAPKRKQLGGPLCACVCMLVVSLVVDLPEVK